MLDKTQSSQTMGVEIDAFSLKAVALSLSRGKIKVDALFETAITSLEEEGHVKLLYKEDVSAKLSAMTRKHLVVTVMNDVLIRPLDLQLKKESDIDAVLAFQAEPLLPYPIEDAIVDKIIISQNAEGSRLTVAGAKKEHVDQHLKQWASLGIESEIVSAAPHALTLFSNYFFPEESPLIILHLGIAQTLCVLAHKGKLIASQTIPNGIGALAEALALKKEAASASTENAAPPSLTQSHEGLLLKEEVDALRFAITRTVYALSKQIKGEDVSKILLVGPGATMSGLVQNLCQSLNKETLALDEQAFLGMSAQDLKKFAIPFGAALNALPGYTQLNFRRQDFAHPSPWKRLKFSMLSYLALCGGLALAIMLLGNAYMHYREAEIKRQYLELLNVMNKPYTLFEQTYALKTSKKELSSKEVPSPNELSSAEIKDRLNFLEKDIQTTPQIYPLQANVPLVSDVLAWLSTHSNFVSVSKDKNASLNLESFNYALIKRPEPTKKQEKYQVKVEIEFSSPTPKMAREFHDALIAPNEFVDPKGEIKWNSNKDRYRTSFFLKDRTTYP